MRVVAVLLAIACACHGALATAMPARRLRTPRQARAAPRMRTEGVASPSPYVREDGSTHWVRMRGLAERVRVLQSSEVEHMMGFFNPESGAFAVEPQWVNRVSIVSTAAAVRAMLANEEGWAKTAASDVKPEGILRALLDAEWGFDPLQTPVALTALVCLDAGLPDHPTARLALAHTCLSVFPSHDALAESDEAESEEEHAAQAGLGNAQATLPLSLQELRSGRAALGVSAFVPGEGGRPPPSAYLRYQCVHALCELVRRTGWQPGGRSWLAPHMLEVRAALERAAADAFRGLCEMIALRAASASDACDAVRLTYDLCAYYEASSALQLAQATPGMPALTQTTTTKVNLKLVAHALDVIFETQRENGLWPKGEPILPTMGSEGSLSKGAWRAADLGNSFVFAFDIMDTLLQTLGAEHPMLFRSHLHRLEAQVAWAESSMVSCPGTAAWYARRSKAGVDSGADADSGEWSVPQGVTRGWRSNHLQESGGPLCWASAQVCSALSSMRILLRRISAADVLDEFKGMRINEPTPRLFDSLLDSELQLGASGEERASLKHTIYESMLEPLEATGTGRPFSRTAPRDAKYSAILYGPPGTAKSTVCEAIARHLGWPLLTIDTADLLASGLEHIASRMTYVFERLLALERTVILFDEIEEFCLDRTANSLSMESRMLTTAMLTQLNDLRRKQRCIFFVATNRITAFDSAVTRPGRFDMILMVGTPSLEARLQRLEAKMDSGPAATVSEDQRAVLRQVLTDSYEADVQYFNFLENERLLEALVDIGARAHEEHKQPMALFAEARDVVRAQSGSIVLRGTVREDYIASRSLSRA